MSLSHHELQQMRRVRFVDFVGPQADYMLNNLYSSTPARTGPERDDDVIQFAGCVMLRRDAYWLAIVEWGDPELLRDAMLYARNWSVEPDPHDRIRAHIDQVCDPDWDPETNSYFGSDEYAAEMAAEIDND